MNLNRNYISIQVPSENASERPFSKILYNVFDIKFKIVGDMGLGKHTGKPMYLKGSTFYNIVRGKWAEVFVFLPFFLNGFIVCL
jgi:hypothetical protein